jgi:hypothetical protein
MDSAKIEAIINAICQRIGGEWLLVGGGLVQIEYNGGRATYDIDLILIRHPTLSDVQSQDALFKAAAEIGLDPESVNSAARFFIGELAGWEENIEEWRRGPAGAVYKPSLALFTALKLRRATEVDIGDIQSAVRKEGRGSFREARFRALANARVQSKFDLIRARLGL